MEKINMNNNTVILADYRSGSQYLVNAMANTIIDCKIPHYATESTEILNVNVSEEVVPKATRFQYFRNNFNRPPIDKNEMLRHAVNITELYLQNYNLFKIFKEEVIKEDMAINNNYCDWLINETNNGRINCINLIRKNTLHRFVSLKVAEKSGIWHTNIKRSTPTVIHVDVNNLLEFINHSSNVNDKIQQLFKNSYTLYYEDLIRDPKTSIINLAKWYNMYIGVFENPYTKPTNPFKMTDVISNYTEVCKKLHDTEYAWMLD